MVTLLHLQLCEFSLCFHQDWDVRVGVFPLAVDTSGNSHGYLATPKAGGTTLKMRQCQCGFPNPTGSRFAGS